MTLGGVGRMPGSASTLLDGTSPIYNSLIRQQLYESEFLKIKVRKRGEREQSDELGWRSREDPLPWTQMCRANLSEEIARRIQQSLRKTPFPFLLKLVVLQTAPHHAPHPEKT